jgi:tripartite-type tricarboxylate transporter receptor subunit TctC
VNVGRRVACLAVMTLASCAVLAQNDGPFPSKPIRLIVPYPPGGLPDTLARMVGQRLTESIGQPVIVENRPGAGGIQGAELVAKAAPDGHTLLVADLGQTAINLALYPKLPYDTLRDFAPVSMLGTAPFFLAVHQSAGVASLAELAALARAKRGELTYGSSGVGSPHHLAMETLKSRLGIDVLHVPYKGSGQATPALLGGQVPMLFTVLPTVSTHVKSGVIRLLAVASPQRTSQAPEVPTFDELGVKDMVFLPSVSVLAPVRTPGPIVQRLATEIGQAVRHAETVKRLEAMGIEPVGNSPEEYAAQLRRDIAYYAQAVKTSGAKVE